MFYIFSGLLFAETSLWDNSLSRITLANKEALSAMCLLCSNKEFGIHSTRICHLSEVHYVMLHYLICRVSLILYTRIAFIRAIQIRNIQNNIRNMSFAEIKFFAIYVRTINFDIRIYPLNCNTNFEPLMQIFCEILLLIWELMHIFKYVL